MSFDYFYGQQSDLFTFYRLLKRTPQELDDLFNGPVADIKSADVLGKDTGESGRQVQRFIRLTNLIPELLDMVIRSRSPLTRLLSFRIPKRDNVVFAGLGQGNIACRFVNSYRKLADFIMKTTCTN